MKKATTKYLKLPLRYDERRLVKDLNVILNQEWSSMLYKHNYEGDWSSVALYAPDGDSKNIFSHSSSINKILPTTVLSECEYIPNVINSFKTKILTARLLRLSAGSIIKPHKDFRMGYKDDNCRIHIPITTNDKVTFNLDNEELRLLPGESWYIDANFTHSVSNLGNEDRIHLVIDLQRNDWTDDLFFSLAPKESFGINQKIDKNLIKEMLHNLKEMNNPDNQELIDHYKSLLQK